MICIVDISVGNYWWESLIELFAVISMVKLNDYISNMKKYKNSVHFLRSSLPIYSIVVSLLLTLLEGTSQIGDHLANAPRGRG
jgi:hypothetical protein